MWLAHTHSNSHSHSLLSFLLIFSPSLLASFLLFYLYYSGESPRDKEFLVKDWKGKLQTRLARRYRGVFFKICYDAPKSPVSTHTCTIRYDMIQYNASSSTW